MKYTALLAVAAVAAAEFIPLPGQAVGSAASGSGDASQAATTGGSEFVPLPGQVLAADNGSQSSSAAPSQAPENHAAHSSIHESNVDNHGAAAPTGNGTAAAPSVSVAENAGTKLQAAGVAAVAAGALLLL
ncbi:hypothetical protein DIURU_003960 [Diutina rugosa]|uniref:Uncharacterized protein n=1 Tax=Diutina rugosa TaxID=5481 RepID=A0A642UJG4_DIURU|nr:uncharacterized protein DIURU_003960 [Diutina rugosa]KAA8900144.1 hypothetical protein DIURU_003960 [Diutina rugosa]